MAIPPLWDFPPHYRPQVSPKVSVIVLLCRLDSIHLQIALSPCPLWILRLVYLNRPEPGQLSFLVDTERENL